MKLTAYNKLVTVETRIQLNIPGKDAAAKRVKTFFFPVFYFNEFVLPVVSESVSPTCQSKSYAN